MGSAVQMSFRFGILLCALILLARDQIVGVGAQEGAESTTQSTTVATDTTTGSTGTTDTTTAATTATTEAPSLCLPSRPSTWDRCAAAGTFKSVSKCYYNAPTSSYVYRYDYFRCVQAGSQYYLYRMNCSQPITIVNGDVFNYFNDATKKCDLTPPSST